MCRMITFTPKLIDYLRRKKFAGVVVELVDSATSTSGFSDIAVRPVNAKGLEIARQNVAREFIVEADGTEFVALSCMRGLKYDEDIVFDVKSFFGIKDIVVKGISLF